MTKERLFEIIKNRVDEKGLLIDIAVEGIIPFIEKFVKDTSNPYDDVLVEHLVKYIKEKL